MRANVSKSWNSRLPGDIGANCLLFSGAPDLIITVDRKDNGIIQTINTGGNEANDADENDSPDDEDENDNPDDEDDQLPSSQESGRLQMGHQMTSKPYTDKSFQPDKVGELVAALHTALSCRALRKCMDGKKFTSLKGHGLFVHRAVGVIHVTVTLSKDSKLMIASRLLVDGVLNTSLFCPAIKCFFQELKKTP